MTDKHTPLPWRLEHFDSAIADTGDYSHCDRVKTFYGRIVFDIWDTEESCEDAELIVKAVNAHRLLVEALREACDLIWSEFSTSNGISESNSAHGVWQKAKAALRAAGEDVTNVP